MTNDPPDVSRQCGECLEGFLLPDRHECPNPACVLNEGTTRCVALPVVVAARWAGDFSPPEEAIRYVARRVVAVDGQPLGWAWRRE